MAEFKLGRIRFVWKGTWTESTTYFKDDIVRHGGNTYVCINGHTSGNNFTTDFTSYWNKISDGQEWKGIWAVDTDYKINDIVKYGGNIYIANQAHTSASSSTLGLENDLSKWDLYAEGFDYLGDWNPLTRYKVNDIVKYRSIIYICTNDHTSAVNSETGLEANQSDWDVFSKGITWLGDWTTATRYVVNDIVKYGGYIYVCNTGHTSAATSALGLEADQSKWDFFHKGIEYKGNWVGSTRYKVNDLVKSGGGIWICVVPHTSQAKLADDESKWAQFVEGLEFENSWVSGNQYQAGDFVTYGGYSFVAKRNNNGTVPTDTPADWDLFNSGFRFVGDYAEDSSLQDYRTGDVVRLGGYTYLCIQNSNGNRPPNATYWERLNSGIYWKDAWVNAAIYDAGDAVRYGDNSYICVQAHTADQTIAQNRPDQDVLGTYWNILAAGAESSVLTTNGDMLYYSGSGPTRLPIGLPGQVLQVNPNGNAPIWKYWGAINHVYYVETNNGVDQPAPVYGLTLDQPWKTVRYAAEQVELGPLNPNAKRLLEVNRSFIQAEIVEWIDYQIANAIAPFTISFVYDKTKCRRDMGILVDALIYDLGHGGNVRSRQAALAYFTELGASYITGQEDETVAAINYGVEVIDAVLSNLAPAANYQTLNSVPSPITQVIDTNYTEETNAQIIVESLLDIVTDAITAGNVNSVPAERKPNSTIFVKTGEFAEVLPIIVPADCAVVGDELRSTRITPAGSLVSSADTPYSLDALTRLKAIMSNVVSNPGAIVKTAGNALNPVTTRPVGTAGVGTIAAELVQQIYDYIDWGVNGATGDSTVPLTTGTNTPQTSTDYTYAVESIEANRAFIKAEILAYIALTYPSYIYDTAACARDVDRYLDAIKYDLIYTGNYKSLLAARYYVNAVNGSTQEDMFYLRNGTGLRNCTLSGLTGTLGAPNVYGTRRPTAGSFVSLDPGWGPDDTRAWITTKSPYVQNVTNFGTACVGMKVDGNLHNGGNDSIVANDFTQIISDGIGVWCTELARTELVSVFSYYAHIGYLAEHGGKIRATNGNSSYGTYGTVAEGVDATETPITATINNRSFDAVVSRVFTDGNNILVLEYLNAGVNYTAGGTTISLAGEGFGATINSPVVKNGSVFEVRLLDTDVNLDGEPDTGGAGYITATNAAQTGNATSITISNTDIALSSQYIGMAIFIVAGTGAGQYAYIDTYNSGTKVATVRKMSDGTAGWDHLTGATIETELDASTTYSIEPRISFSPPPSALYADTAKGRAYVEDGKIVRVTLWDPGTGYVTAPTMTITDPNNSIELPHQIRIGNGVLAQPTWTSRGSEYVTAEAVVTGDGYADLYQPGSLITVQNLTEEPQPGSNVVFAHLPMQTYKLVAVRGFSGTGPYVAQLQVSPDIAITDAAEHDTVLEMRIRYSQVRLTGHDFLDIGTGNFVDTNYPNTPANDPDPTKETVENGGGRVFYTSTDQDGNFRVGGLFSVEQATGVATLNADAFNISGLQELSLGELGLGNTGATITEFSTDGTFTANSDSIVPTQKAIKTYITSQIGGGAATLNVNSITAGVVQISGNTITTINGSQINVRRTVNFTQSVSGVPIALNYFIGS